MTRLRTLGLALLVGFTAPCSFAAPPEMSGRAPIRERESESVSVVMVGRASAAAGSTVAVPVSVRDAHGSPLGAEKSLGAGVQNVAFRVRILPTDAVVAVRVERAGVARRAATRFEVAPRTNDGVAWLASFDPSAPLQLAPRIDNTIAILHLTLAPNLPRGTRIELRLDPAATVLGNAAGTAEESAGNGWVHLRDGLVTVR